MAPEFDPRKQVYSRSLGAYHRLIEHFEATKSVGEADGVIEDTELQTAYEVADQSHNVAIQHYFTQMVFGRNFQSSYHTQGRSLAQDPFAPHVREVCRAFPGSEQGMVQGAATYCHGQVKTAVIPLPLELREHSITSYQAAIAEWEINRPTIAPARALELIDIYIGVPSLVSVLIQKALADPALSHRAALDFVHQSIAVIESHVLYGFNDGAIDLIPRDIADAYHREIRRYALPHFNEWQPANGKPATLFAYVDLFEQFHASNQSSEASDGFRLTAAQHAQLFEIAYATRDPAIQGFYSALVGGKTFVTRYAEDGPMRRIDGSRDLCFNFGRQTIALFCSDEIGANYESEPQEVPIHLPAGGLSQAAVMEVGSSYQVPARPIEWIGNVAGSGMRHYAQVAATLPFQAIRPMPDGGGISPNEALEALEKHAGSPTVVAQALDGLARFYFDRMQRGAGVNRSFALSMIVDFFDDMTDAMNSLALNTDISEETKTLYVSLFHDKVRTHLVVPTASQALFYRYTFDKQLHTYREAVKGDGTLFADALTWWDFVGLPMGTGGLVGLGVGMLVFHQWKQGSLAARFGSRVMPRLTAAATKFSGKHPLIAGAAKWILPAMAGALIGAGLESSEEHVAVLHQQLHVDYGNIEGDHAAVLPVPKPQFLPEPTPTYREEDADYLCEPYGHLDCRD